MVSMTIISAPFAARTSSAKMSYASSKERSPSGERSRPIGPMSRATFAAFPDCSTAARAFPIAATISACRGYPVFAIFKRFAPKVFAYTTCEPASI